MNIMISVIVPIYNVEEYLPACIESIINQTYRNLEVLLVDDGSTDNSGKICDDYAEKDKRCIVIHQQNKGLSGARNTGLDNAKGEYISFIDGDDYIHPQMLEILYKEIEKENCDFAMISHKKVFNKLEQNKDIEGNINVIYLNRHVLISGLYNKTNFLESDFQAVWNKLYKKILLKNMIFKKNSCEDIEFNNRVYLKTQSAVFINLPLYYWFQRSNSISHQPINLTFINRCDTYMLCLKEIPQIDIQYKAFCLEKLYKTIINVRHYSQKTLFKTYSNALVQNIKAQTIKEFVNNKYITIFMKIVLLVFYYIPVTYTIFISLCNLRYKLKK